MNKKVVTIEEIKSFSRQELVDKVSFEDVSVLLSLGADKLLKEMNGTGKICRFLINLVCSSKDKMKCRRRAIRILKIVGPAKLMGKLPKSDKSVVLGFNHPSLGEIFRLLYLGLEAYPERDFFFPVNIPWFENLAPVIDKLNNCGIYLTPMITPSTDKKLNEMFKDNEERLSNVKLIKTSFERVYMKVAANMAENNAIIVVAPSATRQATVFIDEDARTGKRHIHPAMTLLARNICKSEECGVIFLPIVVFEPILNNRKLNLFKEYTIYTCEPFSTFDVLEYTKGHSREFDFDFLKRIDDIYTKRTDILGYDHW